MSASSPLLLAYCRAGFERECAEELGARTQPLKLAPAPKAETGTGLVIAIAPGLDPAAWSQATARRPLVFTRASFVGSGPHALPDRDRITPLLAQMRADGGRYASLWLEFADTNAGKAVSGLCRRLEPLLANAARTAGVLVDDDSARARRWHGLLLSPSLAYAGTSLAAADGRWPMGIPRLSMPRDAPSRSTLKLAEAWVSFLSEEEQLRLLRPGLRVVDLGAAPGGWTWQFARRGLRVTAVDNASLKGSVADDPLVEHRREDGLRFRPRGAVEWMVCDIVEQPARIANLVAGWMADGACRRTIFNLKLPMKKRYQEVERCARVIEERIAAAGVRCSLRFRQLYHDREEVTGYCARQD